MLTHIQRGGGGRGTGDRGQRQRQRDKEREGEVSWIDCFVLFLLFKFIIYLCCMYMYEHIYRNFGLLNESEFMYPRSKWVCLVGIKYQIYYNCRKIYEYLK